MLVVCVASCVPTNAPAAAICMSLHRVSVGDRAESKNKSYSCIRFAVYLSVWLLQLQPDVTRNDNCAALRTSTCSELCCIRTCYWLPMHIKVHGLSIA